MTTNSLRGGTVSPSIASDVEERGVPAQSPAPRPAQPKRIQMSRQHPWRADNPDAVIVARPSKWGNPYRLDDYRIDYADADEEEIRRMAASDFRGMLEGKWGEEFDYPLVHELAGKDLACWCPLDQPCHADVLLELANGTSR